MRQDNSNLESDRPLLAARLREARRYVGMTQQVAAEAIGVDPNTIARYEAGRIRPSSTALFALSQTYKKSVEWFYGEEEGTSPTPGPDDIDITDPELSLFFRGEWDELTEEEKEFIKGMIRESRELLRKRREAGRQ